MEGVKQRFMHEVKRYLLSSARGRPENQAMLEYSHVAQRIRDAIRAAGMTNTDLAERLGVSVQAVGQWMKKGRIDKRHLPALAACTGKPVEYFLADNWQDTVAVREMVAGYNERRETGDANVAPAVPGVRELAVVDYVQAGVWGDVTDAYPRGQGMERIQIDAELEEILSRVAFALRIEGSSMEPEFREGDLIIIDPRVQPRPGDFVVAKLDRDEVATFKKYRERGVDESGQPVFELVPLNPDYSILVVNAQNPGKIIGTMVEHRRRRRADKLRGG